MVSHVYGDVVEGLGFRVECSLGPGIRVPLVSRVYGYVVESLK